MIPRLVPEIFPCDDFCDLRERAAGGIEYSSSWMAKKKELGKLEGGNMLLFGLLDPPSICVCLIFGIFGGSRTAKSIC